MQANSLVTIGVLLVFVGFILIFIGSLYSAKADSKVAIVGLLGPFPFGFGNDKKLFIITLSLAIFLFVLWIILSRQA